MTTTAAPRVARAVMVTGAGSGIGQAISLTLLCSGATVFAGALHQAEVDKINAYPLAGGSVHPVPVDVRDDASVVAAAEAVTGQLGSRPLDGLLNIAGIATNGALVSLSSGAPRDVLASTWSACIR